MNEYKELLNDLHICTSGDCFGCTLRTNKVNCKDLLLASVEGVIEQLVKERDAAVADIEEVIHEEFGDICTICTKYKSCMKIAAKTPLAQPPCERGKWRGVQEVNNGT